MTMTIGPNRRAGTCALELWGQNLLGVEELDLRRTSNKSKRDFEAMLERGAAGRPDDPDSQALAEYGHEIVLPSGEALRRRLGAFTITRGSVDGSRSRAVLGWAIPVGRTLFVLYLESARKFDIEGRTPDDGANAFAEAVRGLIRATRPARLHTPLLSRVFRLVDHAVPLMRTLRTYGVRLYAEGQLVPLDSDDAKFMATIQAAMMDKDAAQTVARLEGDRLTIYGRGEWYLGRNMLPFTWDTGWEMVTDPLTGLLVRRDTDKHTVSVTVRGPELLQLMVRLGSTPGVSRGQIAIALGERGVVSRAPMYAWSPRTLDRLNHPRTAIDSLITRQWVSAFRTGWYEDEVEFTSDLRGAYPAAPLRVDDDGRRWLRIKVRMPAPAEGWGISDEEWDAFEQVQFGQSDRPRGRAPSKAGQVRPLLGLCTYVDGDTQRTVLGFESSGYQLCERPSTSARNPDGSARAWGPEATWMATINCRAWHQSLASVLATTGLEVADQLAPLTPVATVSVESADARRARELEQARREVARIEGRIRGIREERQEARGEVSVDEQRTRRRIARLDEDEERADADLDAAHARLDDVERQPAHATPEPEVGHEHAEADYSTLEAVIAALLRFPGTAPRELADAVHRLLGGSLRWQLTRHGTTVTWTGELHLPLRDGSTATRPVRGELPVSKGTSRKSLAKPDSERQKRLPQRSAAPAGNSAEAYARRFLLDGASIRAIEEDRGIARAGGSHSPIYRDLRAWLLDRGVASPDLARAALDLPIVESRRALYRALTGDADPADTFDTFLADLYRNGIPTAGAGDEQARQTSWGVLWCGAPMLAERRVFDALKAQRVPGVPMSAARLADLADIPYTTAGRGRAVGRGTSLLDIVNGGRRRRAGGYSGSALPLFLIKDWTIRDSRPAEHKTVALRPCPHRNCRGHLQPVPVPEVVGMLLCDTCRRLPSNDLVVFPREYLQPWRGGRRHRDTEAGGHTGTVLAPPAARTLAA
jgi:hypothetical protein